MQAEDAPALQELQEFEEDGDGYAYEHQSLAGSEAIAAAGATAAVRASCRRSRPVRSAARARSVATKQRVASEFDKVERNDPCPCGSGKKYKKCHGA